MQTFNTWWGQNVGVAGGIGGPEAKLAAENKLQSLYKEKLIRLNIDYPIDALSSAMAQEINSEVRPLAAGQYRKARRRKNKR